MSGKNENRVETTALSASPDQNSLVLGPVVRDRHRFYGEERGRDHASLRVFHQQSVMAGVLAPDLRYVQRGHLVGEVYLVFGSVHESLAVLEPSQLYTHGNRTVH